MLKGYVHPLFAPVANVLSKQLPKNSRGGAALSVYHRGHCVVDVWGGTRNPWGEPWLEDTLAISFSTTKGVASTLLHICADRGLLRYDDPVARYWPEFAANGKDQITVRHVLCHEAGLYHIRAMVDDAQQMTDWDSMIQRIEAIRPAHQPGRYNGYHGLTYGYLVGELVQRVTGLPFAQALQEMLVEPLGLDGLFVGLPQDHHERRALLIKPPVGDSRAVAGTLRHRLRKRLVENALMGAIRLIGGRPECLQDGLLPQGIHHFDFNAADVVSSCMPSANGMFTARSLARLYAALAGGGQVDGQRILSPQRVEMMSEVQNRRRDRVVPLPMHWRLGYHRVFTSGARTPGAFGHFGFGGSGAWCDPRRDLSVGLTLNSGVGTPFGDSRIAFINTAVIQCAERANAGRTAPASAWQ